MNQRFLQKTSLLCLLSSYILVSMPAPASAQDGKLNKDAVLQSHNASIGKPEALTAFHARVINGTVNFTERITHSIDYNGTVTVVEDRSTFKHFMDVKAPQYSGEDLEMDEHKGQ